jgi:hypothetical protein
MADDQARGPAGGQARDQAEGQAGGQAEGQAEGPAAAPPAAQAPAKPATRPAAKAAPGASESRAGRAARDTSLEVARYKAAVDEFCQRFVAKTADTKNFINIFELEALLKELAAQTRRINDDLVSHLVEGLDESKLIRQKKKSSRRSG